MLHKKICCNIISVSITWTGICNLCWGCLQQPGSFQHCKFRYSSSLVSLWKCNVNIFQTDCSIRVSNELGAAHPRVAKFSVIVVNATGILISIVFCAIVLIFRVGLSKLFTSDSEVIEAVSNLTPLLAISVVLNGIQPILSGNVEQK